MKTYREFISEVKNYPIYHGATMIVAEDIIRSGYIGGKTSHSKALISGDLGSVLDLQAKQTSANRVWGISTTRSYAFAKRWAGGKESVVFELDTQKISYNYRIVPVNWNSQHSKVARINHSKYPKQHENEYEEFIITNRLGLKKYVKKIYMDSRVVDHDFEGYEYIMKLLERLYGSQAHRMVELRDR